MSQYRTRAFILRATRMTETSRVVTLFTEQFGKVKVVAKGVDRPKSKLAGSLELFNLLEIGYYSKETSELGTLGDAAVIDSFSTIAGAPRRFGFGSAWCEILDKTSHPDHPRPEVFALTKDYFGLLSRATPDKSGLLFWSSVYKMLVIEGYAPEIDRCASCGRDDFKTGIIISLRRGGLVCAKCRDHDDTIMSLTPKSLDLLRKMNIENLGDIAGLSIDGKTGRNAAEVILSFASYHLGLPRNLKSFKFLETLAE